jgi:hypothetical protein
MCTAVATVFSEREVGVDRAVEELERDRMQCACRMGQARRLQQESPFRSIETPSGPRSGRCAAAMADLVQVRWNKSSQFGVKWTRRVIPESSRSSSLRLLAQTDQATGGDAAGRSPITAVVEIVDSRTTRLMAMSIQDRKAKVRNPAPSSERVPSAIEAAQAPVVEVRRRRAAS